MTAKLENWSILTSAGFFTPSRGPSPVAWLEGYVYGHSSFPDGSWIHTSKIKHVNFRAKKAYTLNSDYMLGSINFDFAILLDCSRYDLGDYERVINKIRVIDPPSEFSHGIDWIVHDVKLEDNDKSLVAVASVGGGNHKVVVRDDNTYGVVCENRLVDRISPDIVRVLKQLPDAPTSYAPYVDFIRAR